MITASKSNIACMRPSEVAALLCHLTEDAPLKAIGPRLFPPLKKGLGLPDAGQKSGFLNISVLFTGSPNMPRRDLLKPAYLTDGELALIHLPAYPADIPSLELLHKLKIDRRAYLVSGRNIISG